jgi:hypothetical protein
MNRLLSYCRAHRGQREPVLFRLEEQSGEVLAIFPELPGTLRPDTCTGYAHLGQHTEVALEYIRAQTTAATPAQYRPLARELRQRGYRLRIRQRISPQMHRARQAAIARWRAPANAILPLQCESAAVIADGGQLQPIQPRRQSCKSRNGF